MASSDNAVLRFGRTSAFGTDFAPAHFTGGTVAGSNTSGVLTLTFTGATKVGTFASGDLVAVTGFTGANAKFNGYYIASGAGTGTTLTLTLPAGLVGESPGSGLAGVVCSKLSPIRGVRSDSLAGGLEFTEDPEITGSRSPSSQTLTGISAGGDIAASVPVRGVIPWLQAVAMNSWTHAGTSGTVDVADLSANNLTIGSSGTTVSFGTGVNLNTALAVGDWVRFSSEVSGLTGICRVASNLTSSGFTADSSTLTDGTYDSGAVWVSKGDSISEGSTKIIHDIEREYTDDAAGGIPRFESFLLTSMGLSGSSSGDISMSLSFVGEQETSPTPTSSLGTPTARIPGDTASAVSDVKVWIDNSSSGCVESFDVTFNNNVATRRCVGTLGASEADLLALQINGSFRRYYATRALYDKFLARTNVSLAFVIDRKDNQGAIVIELPKVRLTSGGRGASGRNQQVFLDAGFAAEVNDAGTYAARIWKWNY